MQNNNTGIKKTDNSNKLKFGDDVSTSNSNGEVIPFPLWIINTCYGSFDSLRGVWRKLVKKKFF